MEILLLEDYTELPNTLYLGLPIVNVLLHLLYNSLSSWTHTYDDTPMFYTSRKSHCRRLGSPGRRSQGSSLCEGDTLGSERLLYQHWWGAGKAGPGQGRNSSVTWLQQGPCQIDLPGAVELGWLFTVVLQPQPWTTGCHFPQEGTVSLCQEVPFNC